MSKRIFRFLAIGICLGFVIWSLGFGLGGCGCGSTQVEEFTTTTTPIAGTTTTTVAPHGISGKISWDWSGSGSADKWGTLLAGIWTSESFDGSNIVDYKTYSVSLDATNLDYNFSALPAANYYMIAILYVKRTVSGFVDPVAGDKVGQYSDGELPLVAGGSTHAERLVYTRAALAGKDFSLNGTFVAETTTTSTSTTTTTIAPGTYWTKQLGTTAEDVGNSVAVDASGNIYLTGWTQGGLDGNVNAGSYDVFLVKYNSPGTKQWTRQFGTNGHEEGTGVAVDAGGNIYVTGGTNGGLDGNTNAGGNNPFLAGYDIFLAKYNSSGIKPWTRQQQFGTIEADWANAAAVDTSGNIYLTGYTWGGLDGNTNVKDGSGNPTSDVFLVKYDSSGVKQWTRQLGTQGYDIAWGIAVDPSGNIYITGDTFILIKYASSGILQWTRQLGAIGKSVAVDASGDIYVTGYTYGGLDGNTNAGGSDIFLVKYDSTGTKQWTIRQIGTSSNDFAYGIAVDTSGYVYITGSTSGSLEGNANAGGQDIFLVKYNSSGTKQWTRQAGTSGDDFANGVAVDASGNIYITGQTWGGLDGNANAGGSDIFLVKYNSAGVKQ